MKVSRLAFAALLAASICLATGPAPARAQPPGRGFGPGGGGFRGPPGFAAGGPGGGMPGRGRPGMGRPELLDNLFPPSAVMRHASEIELTADQREAIQRAIDEAQSTLTRQRWEIEERTAALEKILAGERVDETAALGQMDHLLAAEQTAKKTHLQLLIRIKNTLTPEQQEKLRSLSGPTRRPGRGPGRRMGPGMRMGPPR